MFDRIRKRFKKDPDNILAVPDLQIPAEHPDSLAFLEAIEKKYNIGRVISVGDLTDQCCFSEYDPDPDGESAGRETEQTRAALLPWIKAFPNMEICTSNHDYRVVKKLRKAGIPKSVVSTEQVLRSFMECPDTWTFHSDILVDSPYGEILFIHGDQRGASVRPGANISKTMLSTVQGHHHSYAFVYYHSTKHKLLFDALTGCLIDNKKYHMKYNKLDLRRPILSALVILKGIPHVIPMRLNKKGRWTGEV